MFQIEGAETKGSNPICDFQNYRQTVLLYAGSSLKHLDGADLPPRSGYGREQTQEIPRLPAGGVLGSAFAQHRKELTHLVEPMIGGPPHLSDSPQTFKATNLFSPGSLSAAQTTHLNATSAIIALQNKVTSKDNIIDKMHTDVKNLHETMQKAIDERNLAVERFDQNEKHWSDKFTKKSSEVEELLKFHGSLKEDNTDALIQIDKLVKRIRQIQGEGERREIEYTATQDKLKDSLDQSKRLLEENERMTKDIREKDTKIEELTESRTSLEERLATSRQTIREHEQKINKLYQEMTNQNRSHVEKLTDSQTKFEEATKVISTQSELVDDLNGKMEKLKDINSQLEHSWSNKFRAMVTEKNNSYEEFARETQGNYENLEKKSEQQMSRLISDFQRDLQTVDSELQRKIAVLSEQKAKLDNKLEKQVKANAELKSLLQMAVKADARKEALLEELKAAFAKEKQSVQVKMDTVDKEKDSIDGYKKQLREENLRYKGVIDDLEYKNREVVNKSRQN